MKFNIDDWEEINLEEWKGTPDKSWARLYQADIDKMTYFKKKEKWPIVFKDVNCMVKVSADGRMDIFQSTDHILVEAGLPILEKAVKKARELRDKQ